MIKLQHCLLKRYYNITLMSIAVIYLVHAGFVNHKVGNIRFYNISNVIMYTEDVDLILKQMHFRLTL